MQDKADWGLKERRIWSSDLWIPAAGRVDCLADSKPIPPMQPPDLPSEMGRRIVDQLGDKRGDDDPTLDWKTGSGLEQTMELQIKGS